MFSIFLFNIFFIFLNIFNICFIECLRSFFLKLAQRLFWCSELWFLTTRFSFNQRYILFSIFLELWMGENTLGRIFSWLAKAIHIKLTDKTTHIMVSKIAWENHLLKSIYVLYDKLFSCRRPWDNFSQILVLHLSQNYLKKLKGDFYELCYFTLI